MEEYILFSDLHLGIKNSNDVFLNSSLKLADRIIEYTLEKNISEILFGGDWFNSRRTTNIKDLDVAIKIANKFEQTKLPVKILTGNHDCYLKNSIFPNSLCIFNSFSYVTSITKKTKISDFITLVPWSCKIDNIETPYLFGHFEINGFGFDTDNNFENSIDDFKRFTQVFSGHFHTPKIINNINYIGSCMPFTMHDVNSPRGFYHLKIYNDKKFDIDFIEFTESPKFKIIFSNQELKQSDIEGNIIKLVYVNELSSIENENLMKRIEELNPVQIIPDFNNINTNTIIEVNEDECSEENIKEVKNSLTLLHEYLHKIDKPDYIKEETTKLMIKQLLEMEKN